MQDRAVVLHTVLDTNVDAALLAARQQKRAINLPRAWSMDNKPQPLVADSCSKGPGIDHCGLMLRSTVAVMNRTTQTLCDTCFFRSNISPTLLSHHVHKIIGRLRHMLSSCRDDACVVGWFEVGTDSYSKSWQAQGIASYIHHCVPRCMPIRGDSMLFWRRDFDVNSIVHVRARCRSHARCLLVAEAQSAVPYTHIPPPASHLVSCFAARR